VEFASENGHLQPRSRSHFFNIYATNPRHFFKEKPLLALI
jgi:hypothetical protein